MIKEHEIARLYWFTILRGRPPSLSRLDIDHDGRTRQRSIRELQRDGVIGDGDEHGRYSVQPARAEAFCPAERPDLAALRGVDTQDDYQLGRDFHGLSIDSTSMTLGRLRFVAENPGQYRFTNAWGTSYPPTSHKAEYVTDDAFVEAVERRRRQHRVAYEQQRGLGRWLAQQGIIGASDATAFECSNPDPFGRDPHFGLDPTKWTEDAA
ncbi:MAG: hypothetical protein ACOYOB_21520, partial [Myxococcota bacterium]